MARALGREHITATTRRSKMAAANTYVILLLFLLSLILTGYGKPRSSFRTCLLSNKKASCRVNLGYGVRNRQKFSKARCPYNTNGLATFNIVQLCGDVQPNPAGMMMVR